MTCNRREMLYTIGIGAAATSLLGCTGTSEQSNLPTGTGAMCGADFCFKLSENAELEEVGGIMFFVAGSRKLLIRRVSETELIAISAVCTHAACTVGISGVAPDETYSCPCHGSRFALDGSVINGPARDPLRDFATTLAGDDVTVSLA